MNSDFEIREPTDLSPLLKVRWRNLYPDKVMDPELSRTTDTANETTHFIAMADSSVVGCVTLTKDSAHGRNLRMRWLGVDNDYRGKGIGAALVQACLTEAGNRRQGIWLNARLSATSLYRRLGFEELGNPFELPEIGLHLVMRTTGPHAHEK